MIPRAWRSWLPACCAMAVALAGTAGCGTGGDGGGHPAAVTMAHRRPFGYARSLFNEICAGCHTLADAGAHGKRFDLDNDPLLSRGLVWHAIKFGEFGMPRWRGVLSEREVAALARYVDAVAKRRNGETGWGAETKRREEGEPPERRNQLGGKPS